MANASIFRFNQPSDRGRAHDGNLRPKPSGRLLKERKEHLGYRRVGRSLDAERCTYQYFGKGDVDGLYGLARHRAILGGARDDEPSAGRRSFVIDYAGPVRTKKYATIRVSRNVIPLWALSFADRLVLQARPVNGHATPDDGSQQDCLIIGYLDFIVAASRAPFAATHSDVGSRFHCLVHHLVYRLRARHTRFELT